jgi:AhpC/TSA family/Thiol:disulfide interchange protein DsbD, N-terminal
MSLATLKTQGITAASITYDSGDVLKRFAQAYRIDYPMLSDEGSKVIRAFGILNTNIPADHPMLYGIPFPGDYLIAPDGIVRDKVFLPSYEHRPSATQIAMRHGDDARTNSVQIKTDVLRATVSLSADKCFPGQELGVTLEVSIEPGWHIYGAPVPKTYQATVLEFEGILIGDYSLDMPPAKPVLLQALGETLQVYEGEIRARGKLGVKWSPPIPAKFLQSLGPPIEPGPHHIQGSFRFQACSDRVCEAPETVKFQLPLTIEAGIPAPPKK